MHKSYIYVIKVQGKQPKITERLALMIRDDDHRQPLLPGFEQFFGVPLDEENRWIKLSKVIPWEEFAEAYYQNMNASTGRPACQTVDKFCVFDKLYYLMVMIIQN